MRTVRLLETAKSAETFSYHDSIAVVIDVLRATSTMVTALMNGAKEVIPVKTVEQAREQAKELQGHHSLLCGERKGLPIEGFDLGNSPLEYTPLKVRDKTIILTTSNGTRALASVSHVSEVFLLSFLNMGASVHRLTESDKNIHLICAGSGGHPSVEDLGCAAFLIHKLLQFDDKLLLSELAEKWLKLSKKYFNHLGTLLKNSSHGEYLVNLGFQADLNYCAMLNITDIVPRLSYNRVIHESKLDAGTHDETKSE
ncbi:MAG: 2-phosphosulfolactate phosphatase [candidate division KSB1 bacterium]|nr:2-phosphosulfolactate phosphatase [candidate division KSB1 bacterium]